MPSKSTLREHIQGLSRLPPFSVVLRRCRIQNVIQKWPGFRLIYGGGWDLLHPFDVLHGTETSGFAQSEEIGPDASPKKCIYSGSQPSIVRAALKTLPPVDDYIFVDLGAGKGRPVLVAAEFPFRRVLGVELAPDLVTTAHANLAIARARFPGLCPMAVEKGDAVDFHFPPGNLVLFLYNPFVAEIMLRVVANLEHTLTSEQRSVFVIYYNPVYGECFDASPAFQRYFAGTIPYAREELGFGPDDTDSIVIWQGGSSHPPLNGADARIIITNPGARAELVS